MNIQNQNYDKFTSKKGVAGTQNVDQQMSSSLMSEKLDKRHMVNFSSGNQKNINVSIIQKISYRFQFSSKTNLESSKAILSPKSRNKGLSSQSHLKKVKWAKVMKKGTPVRDPFPKM